MTGRYLVGSEEEEVVDSKSDNVPAKREEEGPSETTYENRGRRYPLTKRRAPRRYLDKEYMLLTDEGELESFEEARRDTRSRELLSVMQDEMD